MQKKTIFSKRKLPSITQLESTAHSVFISQYSADDDSYNKKIIKDIVYNEKSHIVAVFKDYLIYDDLSEFLKRYYNFDEAHVRLPKIFDYYENCSRIFPNYIILHEAKYIYKNIQKKQKMIDNQQQLEQDMEEKEKETIKEEKKNDEHIFNTEVYNSIMNQTGVTEEELASIFNNSYKMQGNPVHLENSFASIEKLIDCIGDAEKSFDKNHTALTNRDSSRYNPVLKMMPPNQRLDYQFKSKEKDGGTIPAYANHCQASRDMKRNVKLSEMLQVGNKISEKNQSNILTEKLEAFEANIIMKKIKTRNIYQNEFGNLTALQERLKEEYKKDFGINHNLGVFHSMSMLKDSQRSQIRTDKSPDMLKLKPKVGTDSKKSTLSVPKMTNNIFYIINQNPQVNTNITIYNNNPVPANSECINHASTHAVNSSALRSDRGNGTPNKFYTARDPKSMIGFLMSSDKNSIKHEIKSKKLGDILMGANMSRNNLNLPKTPSMTRYDSLGKLKESLKKEELLPSNTLEVKQLTRTSSALQVKSLATVQYDHNSQKKEYPPEHISRDIVSLPKEININFLSNSKMKFDNRASSVGKINPNLVISRGKHNLHAGEMNNFEKVDSPSPTRKTGFATITNTLKPIDPFEYKIISCSTKREITRPSISELINQKEKQMKKIMEQNLIAGKIKRFRIKGFNDAIKQGSYIGSSRQKNEK